MSFTPPTAHALRESVEVFQAQLATQAPPEVVAQFGQHMEDLVKQNVGHNAVRAGANAPDFSLPDARGGELRGSTRWAKGPVVLTFYRGAWCPYCNLHLHSYQGILPRIRELGAELVAVSPQTPDNSLGMVEKNALEFSVLSDVGNQVARQYGLVFTVPESIRPVMRAFGADVANFNGDATWELPVAGTFLIDRGGRIGLASVNPNYTSRLEPAEILQHLERSAHQRRGGKS